MLRICWYSRHFAALWEESMIRIVTESMSDFTQEEAKAAISS